MLSGWPKQSMQELTLFCCCSLANYIRSHAVSKDEDSLWLIETNKSRIHKRSIPFYSHLSQWPSPHFVFHKLISCWWRSSFPLSWIYSWSISIGDSKFKSYRRGTKSSLLLLSLLHAIIFPSPKLKKPFLYLSQLWNIPYEMEWSEIKGACQM